MPILLWVLEDETLGDVPVTIIATGFDIEQQNGIVNTEPKKNYSYARGMNKEVFNPIEDSVPAFDLHNESSKSNSEENCFELLEDKVVSRAVDPVLGNEDLLKLRQVC
jgi:cell division protein FtsZ